MIVGIGIDIATIEEFRRLLADPATRFLAVHFTPGELAYARAHGSEDPARHLAARYAAKEAVIKAVSGLQQPVAGQEKRGVDYREIEVVNRTEGAPLLQFHGAVAAAIARGKIQRAHLSLSHDGDIAVAMVVLE